MNTLVTLFGGMLAVLVLYALGGLIRGLPPMLRSSLAGLIPLVIYFLLIIGRWPGLDVVAMHISLYLAAALVMHNLTKLRKRDNRMHWVPKLLIAFFSGLAVVNASLLYIATSGLPEPIGSWWLAGEGRVYSGFSGVVSHDRSAARAVTSELEESHREQQVGWQVEIDLLGDAPARGLPVTIRVRDRTGLPIEYARAVLELTRFGASTSSVRQVLVASAPGVYQGVIELPADGRWLLDTRLFQGSDLRFHNTQEITQP